MPEIAEAGFSVDEMPVAEQEAFFAEALPQADALPTTVSREIRGPVYEAILKTLALTNARLQALDPTLTPEHLKWLIYSGAYDEVRKMSFKRQSELAELRHAQLADLKNLAKGQTAEHLRTQNVPKGVLAEPPYLQRSISFDGFRRSYTNACFRMMFAGLTGQALSEELLDYKMKDSYQRNGGDEAQQVRDDEAYWKLFQTGAFARLCPKAIRSVNILGADLQQIDTIADRVKKRLQGTTFCVVSLELEYQQQSEGVVQNYVLLGTDEESAVMHDPGASRSSPYCELPRDEFATRWAVALNRAQLIIATPPRKD